MAITHSDFLTQVRSYTEVDSNVLSDTLIDQFIRHTELDVAGKVDYDDIRKYATSNFNASKRFLTMPSAFLVIRSLQVFASSALSSARTMPMILIGIALASLMGGFYVYYQNNQGEMSSGMDDSSSEEVAPSMAVAEESNEDSEEEAEESNEDSEEESGDSDE